MSAEARQTRRLFFAVELAEDVRNSLYGLSERLRKASNFTSARIVWVPPENFHLTLFFLGETPLMTADRLAAELPQAVADLPAFTMDCRHVGVFPREKPTPPKVLWIGIHQPPEALLQLRDRCASLIARCGLAVPDQNFSPHVTLARFKSTKGLGPFTSLLRDYQFHKAGVSPVRRVVLMESHTGGGPARYEPYATGELKK